MRACDGSRSMWMGVLGLCLLVSGGTGCTPRTGSPSSGESKPVEGNPAEASDDDPRYLLWTRPAGGDRVDFVELSPQLAMSLGKADPRSAYGVILEYNLGGEARTIPLFACGDTCQPCMPSARGVDCPPDPPVPCPKPGVGLCPKRFGRELLLDKMMDPRRLGMRDGRPVLTNLQGH